VGKAGRIRPRDPIAEAPGRKCRNGQAVLRLWIRSQRFFRTAVQMDSEDGVFASMIKPASARNRSRWTFASALLTAPFAIPRREPNQPHKVGEINSCPRQRRRLFHSRVSGGRPNRAAMALALSWRTQCRYRASIITVAAYQRQGCSQSGSRLIVCPQTRQTNRRTQMTIHPVSVRPQTCRLYIPCPTTCKTPSAFRAVCPQKTQKEGRAVPNVGASALRAHSCSTHFARLCRMTTAVWAAVVDLQSGKESCRSLSASFPTAVHPNQMSWKSQSACRLIRHDRAGSCECRCGSFLGAGMLGTTLSP